MKTEYRERDYTYGAAMLKLRTAIGLTQDGLAKHLGVSRRAVGEWEAGSSYPKAHHLKELIALGVKNRAWTPGSEAEGIRALWKAAHQKVLLNERWLSTLLDQGNSPHLRLVPRPAESSQEEELVEPLPAPETLVDWDDALAVPSFYGREEELAQLSQWIVQEHCRVVSVLGMGGIGKSALSVSTMYQHSGRFEVVIFRSLRDAPGCSELLDDCLQVLSPVGAVRDSVSTEQRISLLLSLLRTHRILLVLDNLECLLEAGDSRGHFRPGFEGYGQLLRRVAETSHQSCLLITSREKPAELRPLEGEHGALHSMRLAGLGVAACKQLFAEKELIGTEQEREYLIEAYSGNPLALKIVAETIIDLFDGEIGPFLTGGPMAFGSITDLLDEQFARLGALEQAVLCWLAIVREPVTLDQLLQVWVSPLPRGQLLEAIDSLYRRSLIERGKRAGSFTLQSVVLEYVTAYLVAEASREIKLCHLNKLIRYGLSQATAREYVRQTQERLLLSPLLAELRSICPYRARSATGIAPVEEQLLNLLNQLREWADSAQGYGPANLIALLRLSRGHLKGLDLSRLSIRGAYLQGIEMHNASLAFALIRDTVLTEAVNATWVVAISPDGKWSAAASIQGKVRVWDAGSQTLRRIWQAHAHAVYSLAFSPDGRTLASGSIDGTVKLWDVERGALLWTGWQKSPQSLAWTSDGSLLASAGADATVRLWDSKTGTGLQTLTHTSQVYAVAFSPSGHLLASGCFDGQLRLWERQKTESCTYVEILSIQTDWIISLVFSPDGRTLASAHQDQTVRLWEVGNLRLLQTLSGVQAKHLAWSLDGRTLACSGTDKRIWLWEVEESRCRAVLHGHTSDVYSIAFAPDSNRLLSGSADGTLRVWNVEIGQCVHAIAGYGFSLYDVDWSPDSAHLVSGGSDNLVMIWDVSGETPPRVLPGHTWLVHGVGWSPDGRFVASCSWDKTTRLWDTTSYTSVQRFEDPSAGLLSTAWSPDGSFLACGTHRQGMQMWDVRAGSLRWVGQPYLTMFYRVAWKPDGSLLASSSDDGSVYLWESANGTPLQRLSGHRGWVNCVVWSPDGTRLASGSSGEEGSGELFMWDVQSGVRLRAFAGHSGQVHGVVWSPRGDQLISGDTDGMLRWWDVEAAECVRTRVAHEGAIRALRVSPNGRWLASCGDDGAITIWDLHSGEHVRTLRRDRPYERLNITGIMGLNEAQKASLLALGAIEEALS